MSSVVVQSWLFMIVVFKSWIGSAVHVLNVIFIERFKSWIGSAVHVLYVTFLKCAAVLW